MCYVFAKRTCRADGALSIALTKRRKGDAIRRNGGRTHLIREEVYEVLVKESVDGVVTPNVVVPRTRARVARRKCRRR